MQTYTSSKDVNPRVLALIDKIKSRKPTEVREDRAKHPERYEQADRLLRLVRERKISAVFFPSEYLGETCNFLEDLKFEKPCTLSTSMLIPYLSTAAKRDIQALYGRISARSPADASEDRAKHPERYEQADRYQKLRDRGIFAFGMGSLKELNDFVEDKERKGEYR